MPSANVNAHKFTVNFIINYLCLAQIPVRNTIFE